MDSRETLITPLHTPLIQHAADRAAASSEVGAFMARHARCAILQSEGPATRVTGQRVSAECLDCGASVEWWTAPAGVTALVGLN